MIAEIRTYTAKEGMLDTLIDVLNAKVFVNHRAFDIPVVGMWSDRALNQVTWIRTFESLQDKQDRLSLYEASAARIATVPAVAASIAKPPEARTLEDVYVAPGPPARDDHR